MGAKLLALVGTAILLAEPPPSEKYCSVKVVKIASDPDVPFYSYTLSANYVAGCSTPIDAKEGSEVKFAIQKARLYILDRDGKVHECNWIEFIPPKAPQIRK